MANVNENTIENKLKEYLLGDMEDLKQVVNEINAWNGELNEYRVHDNDEEFFEVFFEGKPMEAVRATHYGEYKYNDDLVRFNGYGNLVSLSEYEYEEELKEGVDDIIGAIVANYHNIDLPYEVDSIINSEEEEI